MAIGYLNLFQGVFGMKNVRLIDVGRVIRCEERVKDGKVFFILIVDGYNSVYRVFHVESFDDDELVLVFVNDYEKRYFIRRMRDER